MPAGDPNSFESPDMALVDDEALIVLARECGYGPARDEIMVRYSPQTERLIQWLARTGGVNPADVDDARQNAVFWTVEAIKKYDQDQEGRERRCSFHSFLHRVLVARFKDFARKVHRQQRRHRLSADTSEEEASVSMLAFDPASPQAIAETEEAAKALQAAVEQLDDEAAHIWKRLCEGVGLREIAGELGISYDAAKRRRRKLLGEMKSKLAERTPGPLTAGPAESPRDS
ncbi:MAG: sigma-70 family RNA polymerase sigma factor [Planctomycetota bacterium]